MPRPPGPAGPAGGFAGVQAGPGGGAASGAAPPARRPPASPDPVQRRAFLVGWARGLARVLPAKLATAKGLRALAGLAASGRLLAWSAHPAEEAILAGQPVGGVLPDSPGPFAEVVVNNAG